MSFDSTTAIAILEAYRNRFTINLTDQYRHWPRMPIGQWASFKNGNIVPMFHGHTSETEKSAQNKLKTIIENNIQIRLQQYMTVSENIIVIACNQQIFTEHEIQLTSSKLQKIDPELFEKILELFEIRQVVETDIDNYVERIKQSLLQ